jgi:hypothetical protein
MLLLLFIQMAPETPFLLQSDPKKRLAWRWRKATDWSVRAEMGVFGVRTRRKFARTHKGSKMKIIKNGKSE